VFSCLTDFEALLLDAYKLLIVPPFSLVVTFYIRSYIMLLLLIPLI
jgi:hypothetical protein